MESKVKLVVFKIIYDDVCFTHYYNLSMLLTSQET